MRINPSAVACAMNVGRVDSDPFFLGSQHVQESTGDLPSFKKREFAVKNCRPPLDDDGDADGMHVYQLRVAGALI